MKSSRPVTDNEDVGDPPSPITFIPVRRQSHLPSISEIHHLRLSLNEKLMQANHEGRRASRTPFVTAPSSPVAATRKLSAVAAAAASSPASRRNCESTPPPSTNHACSSSCDQDCCDLQMLLMRDHYKSQKSFVHSNHETEMRRVRELREVKSLILDREKSADQDTSPVKLRKDVATLDGGAAFFKRNSFLRNSWNVILRQSMRLGGGGGSSGQRSSLEGEKRRGEKPTSQSQPPPASGSSACGEKNAAGKCSSDSEFFANRFSFQSLRRKATGKSARTTPAGGHKRNSSTSSFFSNR